MVRIAILSAIPVDRLPPAPYEFVFWNFLHSELGYLVKNSESTEMILASPTIKRIQFGEINLFDTYPLKLNLIPKYSQTRSHKTSKLALLWNVLLDFIFLGIHTLFSLAIVVKSRANVILDMGPYLSSFSAVLTSKLSRKPLIVWKRGDPIKNAMLHSLNKKSFVGSILLHFFTVLELISVRKANLVICDSLETIRTFQNYTNEKIVLLPTSVDLERFETRSIKRELIRNKLGISENNFVLLYAGRLETGKGIRRLIDVVQTLDNQFRLIIAGSGSLEHELRNMTKDYGIQNRVHFLGAVPYDMMPNILHASNCVILLSSAEGTPRILLEALACGKPIIASNVGGIAEMFSNNTAIGERVMEITPENISKAIHRTFRIEQDSELKMERALLRRNFINSHYSLKLIRKKFLNYIKDVEKL